MLTNPLNWNGNYLQLTKTTPDSLESKFLAERNTDEMKDVDNMCPQPAAVH